MPEIPADLYIPPFPRQPPEVLYHYTSRAGLLGITKDRQLWASNARYLNDSRELTGAYDVALGALEEVMRSATETDEQSALEEFKPWLTGLKDQAQSYLCCFSEDGDDLTQWRAYGRAGDSYSIGFPTNDLVRLAQPQRFFLACCIYEESHQRQLCERFLNAGLERFRANRGRQGIDRELNTKGLHVFCLLSFLYCAAIIKDKAFKEEREWRLIAPFYGHLPPGIRFRAGRSLVIPYIPLMLGAEPDPLPIHDAVVGPSPHGFLDSLAVLALLTARGAVATNCRWSPIPFRDW